MGLLRVWPMLAILAIPGPAWGADLLLSLAASVEYDSNVFRNENNEKEDGVFRGVPRVILEERGEELEYRLMYSVPYERGFTESRVDDFDQIGFAKGSFSVTDRLRVYGSECFTHRRAFRQEFGDTVADNSTDINNNRQRVTRNDASAGFSYQLMPRLSAVVDARHQYFQSSQDNQATNWSLNGSVQLQYALTPRHRIGGGHVPK